MGKKDINIAVDVDGVIRDFVTSCVRVYRKKINPEFELKPFHLTRFYKDGAFNDIDFVEYFLQENAIDVFWNAEAYNLDQDVATIDRLRENFNLFFVSDQPKGYEHVTASWLFDKGFNYDGLVFTRDKGVVNASVGLDDKVENLMAYQSHGTIPVAFTRPWNVHYPGERVRNLQAFEYYLNDLLR